MAATENANANAALSPRATTGEAIGTPHTPPRRNSSGAARTSSPPWNQSVQEPEGERMRDPTAPPSESLVPQPSEVVFEQSGVQVKGGSSTDGSEAETLPEGTGSGNGSKKVAWIKPNNAARDSGLVMGAVSWPTLSESTKASPKPSSVDPSKNSNDPASPVPQVTTADASASLSSPSSAPLKQTTSNPNSPRPTPTPTPTPTPIPTPNATQHHVQPARQRSMRREGGGNLSSNGGFSHQFPQSSSAMDTSHTNNSFLRTSSGGSDVSVRDHGRGNVTRDGNYRSGGDHPQHRNNRRNNSGSHLRGDGSFGGRRDQDRGNHEWNHHRSFNGRDPVVPPQRGGPRGFIRPPPLPGAAAYIPPPVGPYGSPMGIRPEMQPLYYLAPQPGMPFVGQMPPPVYYPPVDPQLHAQIVNQIDYYFSNENLVKDIYLRRNMDEQGWVPVQLIANFNKVMQLTTDIQLILHAVQASAVVEVQGDKIRKRDGWMKWIMPSFVQFPTGSGSQSPRTPQDPLIAGVQGLVLEEKNANDNNSGQVDVHAGILLRSSSRDMDGLSETSMDGRGC